jgi:methylenetetrahydrofolate dehydrogenase (NADP+) / methenyltetrahydrofolate cyclohydrolase
MAASILDGKQLAAQIRQAVAADAHALDNAGRRPKLVALLATDDPGAHLYAGSQKKACANVGIDYDLLSVSPSSSQVDLLALVDKLNADPSVTGIMIHVPLPAGVDQMVLQARVLAAKDVEATGPMNLGLLVHRKAVLLPSTPAAAFELAKMSGVPMEGAKAVVIGRSVVVGKPLALMLIDAHCTVTVCHTRTKDLPAVARQADFLFVAAGKPRVVTADYIRPGAVVVDVGINQVTEPGPDGKPQSRTVGDVDFAGASHIAGHITPVPGGVGPVTVALLLRNIVAAAKLLGVAEVA